LLATLAPCVSARAFEPFEAITREVDALHGVGRELAVCRRALHLAKGGLGATQRQALRALAMRDRVLVRLVEAQRAQDARDVLSWQAICDRLATERGRLRQALRVSRELGPPIQPRIRPVAGPVRVRFGQAGRSPGTAEFRNGVALGVRPGDTVRATARGKVAFAGVLARSGPVVVIDHGARTYSVYAKIAEALVVRGMEVDPGEPVGRAGFEPLYFSIRRRGHALDPLAWLGRS
jgi:septal ring factor EnvC (AmiA/AmiB activator)